MPSQKSVWYRLGFAFEQARHKQRGGAGKKLVALTTRKAASPKRTRTRSEGAATWPTSDQLLTSGAVALAARALDLWKPRRATGLTRLLKAGLAGAGAALLVELVRPLLEGRAQMPALDERTGDKLVAGAGQGLVYGAVLEPRMPGPALLKGAVYGSVEYAVNPAGGLTRLLAPHGPLKRLPLLTELLDSLDPHDRAYLEHVTFGIALALLYGSNPSSNGIRVDEGT